MLAHPARRSLVCTSAQLVFVLCLVFGVAGSASADRFVGIAGGAAIPYKGQVGWNVLAEFGSHLWDSKHFLGGTEFEFKRQMASPSSTGNGDVSVDQYNLRLIGRFVFAPKKLTPYLGAGGGLGAINTKATSTRPSEFGLSANVLGLVGVNLPLASGRMSIFGEARFGYTWDVTGDYSHVNQKGFDGFTGVGGLRFRF